LIYVLRNMILLYNQWFKKDLTYVLHSGIIICDSVIKE